MLCCRCLATLALLAVSAVADNIDLPVATQGTEQWAGVVAKAMTAGGRSQSESMQALKSFQSSVKDKMGQTVSLSILHSHSTFALCCSSAEACCAMAHACQCL